MSTLTKHRNAPIIVCRCLLPVDSVGAFAQNACKRCFALVQYLDYELQTCARDHQMIVAPEVGTPKLCPIHADGLA